MNELSEVFGEEQDYVEQLLADRPITTLASALAPGVVIGSMLRRH